MRATTLVIRRACIAAVLLAPACTTTPAPRHPRPALPVPPHVARYVALPGEVRERNLVELGTEDGIRIFRGQLDCGEERAEFHVVIPTHHEGRGKPPFVLALPILAGGQELMWYLALDLAERGYAVAWPRRVESALSRKQRGPELERLFRRSIVQARMVLAWARQQDEVDAERSALIGISLGSMIGSAVLAVERDLVAGALCLSGGDLADLVMLSSEPRAIRWRRWRAEDHGIAGRELLRELDAAIRSDPASLGAYVDTAKVLYLGARFDSVVPHRNRELLWESLGRPERVIVPWGHYSAAAALGVVLERIAAFFADRGC